MKYALACIGANLVSGLCVVAAGFIAVRGLTGWGWFLFVAVICSTTIGKWRESEPK